MLNNHSVMATQVPIPLRTVVVGDDPFLCGELSSLLGKLGFYLPIVEGPRIHRPDLDHEVLKRAKAIALVHPRHLLIAGLPEPTCELFNRYFTSWERIADTSRLASDQPVLQWGRSQVGLAVLTALRDNKRLVFEDGAKAPDAPIGLNSKHVVLCETGHDLSQVIAANYAFSIDAGFGLIPTLSDDEAAALLEQLYRGKDLADIRKRLRDHVGTLPIAPGTSVTFVTAKVPWGFAFSEFPSTHLFRYPDLGRARHHARPTERTPDSAQRD